MMTRAALLATALLTGGSALAAETDAIPYAEAFCSLRTADFGAARFYLLSPALAAAVVAALERNAAIAAENPGDKPPLGDGIPYQSYPDAAPSCAAGTVTAEGDRLVAEVKYSFPDAPDAGWTDRLVLVAGDGGVLLVDDIRYGAEGDEGTLRATLDEAFEN